MLILTKFPFLFLFKCVGCHLFSGQPVCDTLAVISVSVATCLPLRVKIMRHGVYPEVRMSHIHT